MRIQVTEKNIADGKRSSATECPVALALYDAGLGRVVVEVPGVYFEDPDRYGDTIELPSEVEDAIDLFDQTGEMSPFGFEIDHGDIEILDPD